MVNEFRKIYKTNQFYIIPYRRKLNFDGIFEEIEYMIYHPSLNVIKISIIFKK